ncbi:PROK1 [Branchiostoma lanceolatum]|uniref:PROK1 protein n=1 Tax=Branchiostoma lanceolatum TaxID=7740 RepID=A0A8K0ER11_BRALA|nr:PROK1 [Branchiostoma lanceolatum]
MIRTCDTTVGARQDNIRQKTPSFLEGDFKKVHGNRSVDNHHHYSTNMATHLAAWSSVLTSCLLVSVVIPSTVGSIVITGICESDEQCIEARGEGWCCALWNMGDAPTVCKRMGEEGEACHISSNVLPYPFEGARRFWRCPCDPGLTCKVPADGDRIGTCTSG